MDPKNDADHTDRDVGTCLIALETFKERLVGADVILLIDSEAVEAALVKGYSSREDVCSIISVFWDLALVLKAEFSLTESQRMQIRPTGRLETIYSKERRPVGCQLTLVGQMASPGKFRAWGVSLSVLIRDRSPCSSQISFAWFLLCSINQVVL